ncbi:MAG: cysteine protease StiP family protein [Marinagarivorans sp.]
MSTPGYTPFSGSYAPEDVQFVLNRLPPQPVVTVAEKERLIQSGARHYSQMLSAEAAPSPAYQALFADACQRNQVAMAEDCLTLAALIAARKAGPITLISLMRGGTPVGVVLNRLLRDWLKRPVQHYSLSILRDKGLDSAALAYVLAQGAAPESIVFVDGWTGKGVIARELASSVNAFNAQRGTAIDAGLYALVDLAGVSLGAASTADYLLPSSILNATVSGLVSRSLLSPEAMPGALHGCVYYEHLAAADVSRWFVDLISRQALALASGGKSPAQYAARAADTGHLAARSQAYLQACQAAHGISDINLIKPGIGEATRVLLRRAPRLIILRASNACEVAHLRLLAEDKHVPVVEDPSLPYQAVSLIKSSPDG